MNFDFIATILVIIGAINWGLIGILQFNVVNWVNAKTINNELFEKIVYSLVGVAAVYLIVMGKSKITA